MNKLIKSAMMMASVGAMLCIVGCGNDNGGGKQNMESEFVSLQNKAVAMQLTEKKFADEQIAKFKKLSPEEQKKAIEEIKKEIGLK